MNEPRTTINRRAALAAAGGSAAALALGARPVAAASADVAAVTHLLKLEQRLAVLYAAALEEALLPAELARHLRDQEREHVRGLERALTGLGTRPPTGGWTMLPPLPKRAGFPSFALRLEDEAVAAYVETIANLRRPGLIQPLGSIAANEGEHQVILRELAGRPPLS